MIKIVDETEIEFVCASRVGKLRGAALLEEGNLSIFAEGGKQWRYESRNEVLQWIAFRCNVQL
jgi:hypothetical protein